MPLTSLIAFIFTWFVHRQMGTIVTLSRETLVLVPLDLPFFVPLALADRLGWRRPRSDCGFGSGRRWDEAAGLLT